MQRTSAWSTGAQEAEDLERKDVMDFCREAGTRTKQPTGLVTGSFQFQ